METESNVVEGKRLIAEFMGYNENEIEILMAHSDYNCIMCVVEKIEQLKGNYEVYIGKNLYAKQITSVCIIHDAGNAIHIETESYSKKKAILSAIVDFLKYIETKRKLN